MAREANSKIGDVNTLDDFTDAFCKNFATFHRDEFAELLTLVQTQKIKKRVPIVLYSSEYWGGILNLEKMVEWGTISAKDLDLFHYSDTVDDAVDFLSQALVEIEGGQEAEA